MTANITQVPYLRVQRLFPEGEQALRVELDRMYVDISAAVNRRIISMFVNGSAVQNGEDWFITSKRQQGFRQIYPFTAAGNIPHGLILAQVKAFTKIYGTFTDGTNWYPLPYVDVTAANNQVNVYIGPTNIVITAGGGTPPAITEGYIVVEWIV